MKRFCALLLTGALLTAQAAATDTFSLSPSALQGEVSAALTASGAPALPAGDPDGAALNYGAGEFTIAANDGMARAVTVTLETGSADSAQALQYGAAIGAIMKVLTPAADIDAVNRALKLDEPAPGASGDPLLAYYSGNAVLTHLRRSDMVSFSLTRYPDNISGIGLMVNNRFLTLDVAPRIVDSRTLVPLRGIFEEIGATVTWEQETRTATMTRGDSVVTVTIGSKTATVGGASVTLDVPAQLSAASGNARTLVPVRFIAEALGADVGWLNSPQTVVIAGR